MTSKASQIDLQTDFKQHNNKPGSKPTDVKNSESIKDAKQTVKTRD
jgi:hypothetical protein